MEEAKRQQLLERNRQIIRAVQEKAERDCPGAIALIAVTGSFHSGEFYEKSDLDLLIVANSAEGEKVVRCFILGDVAHDIYCHSWERLEKMAEYPHPHVLKLLDVNIVYTENAQALSRYRQLRQRLMETLARPLARADFEKIRGHLEAAKGEFAALCLSEELPNCRRHAAGVLLYTEYALYMLNHACVRHGIRGIPEEIRALPLLPEGFFKSYPALIDAGDVKAMRQSAKALLRAALELTGELENALPKPAADANALRGSYEEIFSNWRNKMYRAAGEGDRYLSLMTLLSCQGMYDDFSRRYAIEPIDLFEGLPEGPLDPAAAVRRFEEAMERLHACYTAAGLKTDRFETMEGFLSDYLS